jgi:hypothetical protein
LNLPLRFWGCWVDDWAPDKHIGASLGTYRDKSHSQGWNLARYESRRRFVHFFYDLLEGVGVNNEIPRAPNKLAVDPYGKSELLGGLLAQRTAEY